MTLDFVFNWEISYQLFLGSRLIRDLSESYLKCSLDTYSIVKDKDIFFKKLFIHYCQKYLILVYNIQKDLNKLYRPPKVLFSSNLLIPKILLLQAQKNRLKVIISFQTWFMNCFKCL